MTDVLGTPDVAASSGMSAEENRVTPPEARVDSSTALGRIQQRLVLGTAAVYTAGHAVVGLVGLLIAVVVEAAASRRLPWRRSALDPYLVAFISVFIISGLLSSYRSVATGSAVLAALTIYLTYGALYRALGADDRFAYPLLWIWYAGGVVAAALGIYFFVAQQGPQATLPALGPNALGSTYLIALVLGVGLLLTTKSPARYVAGGGALLLALALALTLSRGAWIGAASGLVALFLLSRRRRAWQGILLAGVALIVLLGLLSGEAAVLRKKALSIVIPRKNEQRVFLARSALAIAADHPLVGSGLNTFVLAHPHPSLAGERFALKRRARTQPFAHNIFLNMAAEGGLLGLGSFVALLIRGAAAGWRWHASAAGPDHALSAAVLAAFVGLLVHQQFDGTVLSVQVGAGLWFLLAIMVAYERGRPGG